MTRFVCAVCTIFALTYLTSCTDAAQDRGAVDWNEALNRGGLVAAEESLLAQERTTESSFVLGGVQFLRAIETVMQVRYANYAGELAVIPGMRNRLPPNPDASFDPRFFENAMSGALEHLGNAERSLRPAINGEFAVEIRLQDFWLDINSNGAREGWEGLLDLMDELNAERGMGEFDGVIRFDSADADWLMAYVNVVSGTAELSLSLDPTPAIRTVWEGRTALEKAGTLPPTPFVQEDTFLETAAAILLTLRGEPDRSRTRAALAHFRSMITYNRTFWEKVEQETDNDREWLPNAQQTAAFGVEVNAETIAAWKGVLSEIDAILAGETLVPYWRVRPQPGATTGVGLNIEKLFREPGDMDVILWLQGTAAVPYLEEGVLADMAAWQFFMQMTSGDGLLFAIWFN
jgi:hypothetical protein